ncbi:hypothetical protein HPB50_016771 [Hyalomma asiaticum]|uniref:Uncharacterized protein n=1 Tax=Hyalomma asiaticum TaxID=266040 RepID=A0ACB7SXD6_HYAAI|nr:hypothetical protein HPB50_016771 [Hyalomma asiaticum]
MPKAPKARKKILLAAPVSMRWPVIDNECRSKLLRRFQNVTADCDSMKLQTHFVLGLNAVTRALEQDRLSALLLNSSADPPRLLHGLIKLARNKNTPVLCASELQEWVPGVRSLLALGMRRTAPASKPVDDFLDAVRLNAGVYPETSSENGSAVAPKSENETVGKICTNVTPAATEPTVAKPSVRQEITGENREESRAPLLEEAVESACTKTSEPQADILNPEIRATKATRVLSVAADIELSEDGGLGFPDYEGDFSSLVDVIESSSCVPLKTKAVAVPHALQSSCLVKANIKQVFSKGKIKTKKKRGVIKAIK